MNPVRTSASNFVYIGPTVDIGDAWVERARASDGHVVRDVVFMDFVPSDAERDAIARGSGVIRVGIWGIEPIPPVSLEVRPDLAVVDTAPPPIIERPPGPPDQPRPLDPPRYG